MLPKFIITFGGVVDVNYRIKYDDKCYVATDYRYDVDSLHIYGALDPFKPYIDIEPNLYKNP